MVAHFAIITMTLGVTVLWKKPLVSMVTKFSLHTTTRSGGRVITMTLSQVCTIVVIGTIRLNFALGFHLIALTI